MATSTDFVQFICDQAGLGQKLSYRKMFGEYALYLDGKVIALVCDNQLFLKRTPEGVEYLGNVVEAAPFPGAKNFCLLTAELDNPEQLARVFIVTAQALPAPKPKVLRSQAKSGAKKKKGPGRAKK